jgi:hypothetical protein
MRSFKARFFLGQKRSVLVIHPVVLGLLSVHLVTQDHIRREFNDLDADEDEFVTITSSHLRVGQPDHHRHRAYVEHPQDQQFHHESLETRTHLTVSMDAPSDEDQSQGQPKPDEDGPSDGVEEVVTIVLMAQLGYDGDQDVDEAQAGD